MSDNAAPPSLVPAHQSGLPDDVSLLNTRQLIALLKISMGTLHNWQRKGVAPPFLRLPGTVGRRYRISDLRIWLNSLGTKSKRRAKKATAGAGQ